MFIIYKENITSDAVAATVEAAAVAAAGRRKTAVESFRFSA